MSDELSMSDILNSSQDLPKIVDPVVDAVPEQAAESVTEQVVESNPEAKAVESAHVDPVVNNAVNQPDEQTANQTALDDANKQIEAFKRIAFDERAKRQLMQNDQSQVPAVEADPIDAYIEPQQAIDAAIQKANDGFNAKFLGLSESNARSRHTDFDAMQDVFFNEIAAQNPNIAQQAMQQADPYEFVYQQAVNHKEFSGISSMSDYRSKIEAEVRASMAKENADNATKIANDAINKALPNSLANTTTLGDNQQVVVEHKSLGDILGR